VIATFLPRLPATVAKTTERTDTLPRTTATIGLAVAALATFWLSVAALASRGYAPFLYFRF
jgi:hypothetical protein